MKFALPAFRTDNLSEIFNNSAQFQLRLINQLSQTRAMQ